MQYINSEGNHPEFFEILIYDIPSWISTLSSCNDIFDRTAYYSNIALKKANYKRKIECIDISSSDYTDKLKITCNGYGFDLNVPHNGKININQKWP